MLYWVVSWGAVVFVLAGGTWFLFSRFKGRRRIAKLDRIDALLARGEFKQAEEAALIALDEMEDLAVYAELRRRLVWALVGLEEYPAACTVSAHGAAEVRKPGERALALIDKATCLAANGDFDEATAVLRDIAPDQLSSDVLAEKALAEADIALARLKFKDAESALAGLVATSLPGRLRDRAMLGHARLQYLKGNFRQAIAELNRLLETIKGEDHQAEVLLLLALALVKQERPSAAEADQALSKAQVLAHYPGLAAVVAACQSLLHAHFGNERDMLEAATRASRMTVSRRYATDVQCLIGDAYFQRGQFADARAAYQRALGTDAGCLDALWGLGTCAQMTGLYEIAETYFRMCTEAAPEHFLGQRSEAAIEA